MEITKKILGEINADPEEYAHNLSVKDLVGLLKTFSEKYYNTGNPIVSDEVFDKMRDVLSEKDPENKFLKNVGAVIADKNKVKLPHPMSSLDKIKPQNDTLKKWITKYKGPYVVSDKLDGVSAMLYIGKTGPKLYTRGDGTVGQDITHLIKYVIRDVDLDKLPEKLSIRGELVISKKKFEIIKDEFSNARNTVSGLVNSKTVDKRIAKLTNFIAYAIIFPEYPQDEQMEKMNEWEFDVVEHKLMKKITNDGLTEYLRERRSDGVYEIDGLVIVDSSKKYSVGDSNPKHAVAFKAIMNDQIKETTVNEIKWEVSRGGLIKPVIKVKPIEVSGVVIESITGHNARFVTENEIGPGAKIKIIRSGDVIPKVHEVVKGAKPNLPEISHKWNKNKVEFIVNDIHSQNDTITIKKIVHFFKKLEIKNLDEGTITKLFNAGYDTIAKILKAKQKSLARIEGLGEKSISKIYDNINNGLKNANLATFMAASQMFGMGLGEKKIKLIVEEYPDILDKDWDDDEMINKINGISGFSDITTSKFIEGLNDFKDFYEEINDIIDISHLTNPVENEKLDNDKNDNMDNGLFKDMIVVFTGFRNKDWEKIIEKQGGKIGSSISGKTSLVVYGGKAGSKLEKAKEKGVKIMSKEEFEKKYV